MHPISARLDDMDDRSPARQRDRDRLRHDLNEAARGDPEAKRMLKQRHLTGWYSKIHGDVIGDHLSGVVREREGR